MADTDEVEKLKDALVLAEEALADATIESENRLSEIHALRTGLKHEERARADLENEVKLLKARLGIPSIVRNVKARCHSCGAEVITAATERPLDEAALKAIKNDPVVLLPGEAFETAFFTAADTAALEALSNAQIYESPTGVFMFQDTDSERSVCRAEVNRRVGRVHGA